MNKNTKKGLVDLILKEKQKTGNIIHQNCLTITSFYLADKLELGKEDIDKYIDYVNDTIDSIHKGFITAKELRDTLKEEFGIEYEIIDIKNYVK